VAQRDGVRTKLGTCRQLLTELEAAQVQAKSAYEERSQKCSVADADKLPAPSADDLVTQLSQWLARLDAKFGENKWREVQVGVGNWEIQAHAPAVAHSLGDLSNGKLVERRRELRGLLDSLKAMALRADWPKTKPSRPFTPRRTTALYTRPTPMVEAEKFVLDYLAAIR